VKQGLWAKYVREPLLRALTELPWFGPVVSAVLVAMLVNVLTDALKEWGGLWLAWAVAFALLLALVAFANAYNRSEIERIKQGLGPVDRPKPEKHRGLIFLYSREDTLREAIQHHKPVLEHCWLVVTPEMQAGAAQAMSHFSGVQFTLNTLHDCYDTRACYELVRDIYHHDAPRLGIPPQRVIADITGGTKPMSAGMFLACLEGSFPIEHVPTAFDALGQPTGPLPPIQIVVPAQAPQLLGANVEST